jgi:hypothetical protein
MLHQNSRAFSEAARRAFSAALRSAPQARRGLLAGTRVDTPEGWRPVETLEPGDFVHGQDGTPKQVLRVDRASLEGRAALESVKGSVLVPAGVLGACTPFLALPGQHLLLHAPRARAALGSDFALVAGRALAGHLGIEPAQLEGPLELVMPAFEEEQAIWVNTGLLAHCPSLGWVAAPPMGGRFPVLAGRSAEVLMELLAQPAAPAAPSPFRSTKVSLPRRVTPMRRGGRRQAATV